MTWQGFYLACFLLGFALSVLAFLGGSLHWPSGAFHGLPKGLPHLGGLHGAGGHAPAPGAAPHGSSVPRYNFATLMVFLAWFGGVGYLLSKRGSLGSVAILAAASAAGLAGSAVIVVFLTKVLLRHERFLEAADFEMVGVLGRVTMPIRAGGTGEIVYSQANTRRSAGARSDSGDAIERGTEVVVTRYEGGLAYVRPWTELAGEELR
ncbi:MAG TPA: NfeD family protein [Thermoanaerobaculia bacterium]|nr:NfeD family protein [Thermoanaerobaculia bacterium]